MQGSEAVCISGILQNSQGVGAKGPTTDPHEHPDPQWHCVSPNVLSRGQGVEITQEDGEKIAVFLFPKIGQKGKNLVQAQSFAPSGKMGPQMGAHQSQRVVTKTDLNKRSLHFRQL
jgi:hypothetical protein